MRKPVLSIFLRIFVFIIAYALLLAISHSLRAPIGRILLDIGLEPKSASLFWGTGVGVVVLVGFLFLTKSLRKQ